MTARDRVSYISSRCCTVYNEGWTSVINITYLFKLDYVGTVLRIDQVTLHYKSCGVPGRELGNVSPRL
jgi:hypothetical protein